MLRLQGAWVQSLVRELISCMKHSLAKKIDKYFKIKHKIDQRVLMYKKNVNILGFPGGTVVENLPANAGDTGSSPGLGRSHMPRSN